MKKLLVVCGVTGAVALTAVGQARIDFNNLVKFYTDGGGVVTVDPVRPNQGPDGGAPGAYVGSAYSVQLLWKAGSFADIAAFLAASPSSSSPVAFYGTTGGNPGLDGAGLFDGGSVVLGGPPGLYTFLVQAWYNGGSYATFDAAAAAGKNVGRSVLFTSNTTAPPTPATTTEFPSFTVWVIPEPGTLALSGLGLAALFLLRRRS